MIIILWSLIAAVKFLDPFASKHITDFSSLIFKDRIYFNGFANVFGISKICDIQDVNWSHFLYYFLLQVDSLFLLMSDAFLLLTVCLYAKFVQDFLSRVTSNQFQRMEPNFVRSNILKRTFKTQKKLRSVIFVKIIWILLLCIFQLFSEFAHVQEVIKAINESCGKYLAMAVFSNLPYYIWIISYDLLPNSFGLPQAKRLFFFVYYMVAIGYAGVTSKKVGEIQLFSLRFSKIFMRVFQ